MKKKPGLLKCSRGPVITFFPAKSSFECMQMSTRFSYNELPANALDKSSLLALTHICQFDEILIHVREVMNELRRFKHSADFLANSSHIIESAPISAS